MAYMCAWSGTQPAYAVFHLGQLKNRSIVTTHNDHPSYVKHASGRICVFFTLFGYWVGGGSDKGLLRRSPTFVLDRPARHGIPKDPATNQNRGRKAHVFGALHLVPRHFAPMTLSLSLRFPRACPEHVKAQGALVG